MKPIIVNALLFQVTYLAAVLGAAAGSAWLGVVPLALLAVHVARHPVAGDLRLTVGALAIGAVLGWFWQASGLLVYASTEPFAGQAPAWIMVLWAGFALTLNHSLRWLTRHLGWAAVFGAIGSPLSYFSASRLGAAEFLAPTAWVLLLIGLVWAALVAGLAWWARRMRRLPSDLRRVPA